MAKTFDWKMYRYLPSLIGPIICIIIFSILASLHLWQWLRSRRFIIVWIVIGAVCEVGGYCARIGSHYNNQGWAAFIIQGVLLLIGPLFFAATIYMMLGRTIRLAGGEQVSIISPRWCTRIFVGADISTLVLQGLGASIMGTMQLELALAGAKVVIAGLALQVATFVAFLVVVIHFQIRMSHATPSTNPDNSVTTTYQWHKMLWILYSVSSLILFRCIFRLIEYAMGNAAYLIAHEWTLFVFDTTPMFLVLVLLLVLQPTNYVPQRNEKVRSGEESEVSGIA